MYRRPPDPRDMAELGLELDDFDEEVDLWPCCRESFDLFDSLATQWRVGMGGPVGLDYAAVEPTLRLMGVPASRWPELFEDIRLMEQAAITRMNLDRQ